MGKIAKYAWGLDYHSVLGEMLRALAQTLTGTLGGFHRWYVDTGPQMDKALAARSGIGWYGKHTNIITTRFGSFVLLGELLTTLELAPDPALQQDCGACRLCQLACPTGALGPDYTIDSRKCISYLTIEHRGPIPIELRRYIGDWVFGCDICQDVCPPGMAPFLRDTEERHAWAAEARALLKPDIGRSSESNALPAHSAAPLDNPLHAGGLLPSVDLIWLLRLSDEQYRSTFRGTAIKRAKAWMLRRNAAVALGNVGDASCLPPLDLAMTGDDHPIVRSHASWAMGRIASRLVFANDQVHVGGEKGCNPRNDLELRTDIFARLSRTLAAEADDAVRTEVASAMAACMVS
jgi:epoxyqueuosine reductase